MTRDLNSPKNKKMKTLGVIVGRYQIDQLHEGHYKLIHQAQSENDKLLIVIGNSPAKLTLSNPLSFEVREKMILNIFGDKKPIIVRLSDQKSDQVWSSKLDELIEKGTHNSYDKITLYCGRDGFKKYYIGKYQVKEVTFGIDFISASVQRSFIHDRIFANQFS